MISRIHDLNKLCFSLLQTIETYFGVSMGYNGRSRVLIEVPTDYWNNTCGLCGTFDDIRLNDFWTREGSVVSRVLFILFNLLQ